MDESGNPYWSHLKFNVILEHAWNIVRAANNYIAQTEPWKLAKSDPEALKAVLFDLWNALRVTALSLYPFMPSTAGIMWKQIGLKELTVDAAENRRNIFAWDWMPAEAIKVSKGEQLFPRIEKEEKRQIDREENGTEKGEDENVRADSCRIKRIDRHRRFRKD